MLQKWKFKEAFREKAESYAETKEHNRLLTTSVIRSQYRKGGKNIKIHSRF